MTWKSTAAASGLMVVATWLASHAPVGMPREPSAAVPSTAHAETAAAQIQREADRLHHRLQQVAAYKLPTRNPFHFGVRDARAAAPRPAAPIAEAAPAPVVDLPPPPPRMSLAGIGEDGAGDQVVRTAIISTARNVHILKVGETFDDAYKVTAITADAVELQRLDDGTTVRLSLKP